MNSSRAKPVPSGYFPADNAPFGIPKLTIILVLVIGSCANSIVS